ncbi:MAG TPA: VWA domain-containing protein [Bryobacteraceae bacterium]|nr:VWA domain-containing protein [Bryobacteraceae bacterium]
MAGRRIVVLLSAAAILYAQGLSPDEVRVSSRTYTRVAPAFRAEADLVEVGVVVRDAHGRAVPGLTKPDFHLFDNEREREISSFSVETPEAAPATEAPPRAEAGSSAAKTAPRYVALFFDDINQDEQHFNDLKQTQAAAAKFITDSLQSGVEIGIFTASGTGTADFTADFSELLAAIGNLRPYIRMSESGVTRCPRITPYLAYLIAQNRDSSAIGEVMNQAQNDLCPTAASQIQAQAEDTWRRVTQVASDTLGAIASVVDRLAAQSGTRTLVIASSGFLAAAVDEQKDHLINRALHADVVISALDSKGLYGEFSSGSRPDDGNFVSLHGTGRARYNRSSEFVNTHVALREDALNQPLTEFAEATGGTFYSHSNDLTTGFRRTAAAPEVTYRLAFHPDKATDGAYHKLKVKLDAKYSIQARRGYFAPSEKPKVESKFDTEVANSDAVNDIPIQLAAELGKNSTISVVATLDISKIRFDVEKDRRKQQIRFATALFDQHGMMVAAKEATMDLSLKESTYTRLLKSGLNAKLTLQAAPGSYSVREVVEESMDHRFSCSTNPVQLP